MSGLGGRGPGKDKGIFNRKLHGQRADEDRDPHRQRMTTSARRVEEAGRGSRGAHGRLLASSTTANQRSTLRDMHREASFDDVEDNLAGSFGTEEFAEEIGSDLEDSDSLETLGEFDTEGTTDLHLRGKSGRFALGRRAKRSRVDSDWVITGPMPGGPTSNLVIPSYGGHIARLIWEGQERAPEVIECLTRKKALRQLQEITRQMHPVAVDEINRSLLWGVADLMFDHIDHPLVAAFVERWQPDTNSFHLPFGEMTIMLHDVQQILGLPVDGTLPPCPDQDMINNYVTSLFPLPIEERRRAKIYEKGGILDSELRRICTSQRSRPIQIRAWYLSLLGNTLLVDKSMDRVRPHAFGSTEHVDTCAWGTVTLAYLYRQLGAASRAGTRKIGGCLTLLQAWIYEHFPQFRPHPPRHVDGPRASMWSVRCEPRSLERLMSIRRVIDGLTEQQVIWCPYGPTPARQCPRTKYTGCIRAFDFIELYMPDRTVRQLGYVQHVSGRPEAPDKQSRPATGTYIVTFADSSADRQWDKFPYGHVLPQDVMRRCQSPWDTEPDYSTWYHNVSHPYLIRSDTPTHSTVDNPDSAEFWAHEWPRRAMPLFDVHKGDHLPVKLYDDLVDLLRRWCEHMHIEIPHRADNGNDR